MVSLRDIGERVGCSASVVSAVLNGSGNGIRASAETRQRIRDVANELCYVPNRMARGLRLSRNYLIGVIAADLSSSFVPEILSGIESYCLHTKYGVLLGAYRNDEQLKERWEGFIKRGVDGIICIGNSVLYSQWARSYEMVKCVYVGDQSAAHSFGGIVQVDKNEVTRLAVNTFAEHGHCHIGYLTNYPVKMCGLWHEELLKHGMANGPVVHCYNFFDEGFAKATAMLSEHPELTGIFADSDLLGATIIAAARKLGRLEGLSVLGVDDSTLCRLCDPELSSIRQPRCEQGEKAAEVLLKMLDGGAPENVVLSASVVLRASMKRIKE